MDDLRKVVAAYIKENGLRQNFFAGYIGVSPRMVSLWYSGERKLTERQIKRVHDFLNGKHLKKPSELNEEVTINEDDHS